MIDGGGWCADVVAEVARCAGAATAIRRSSSRAAGCGLGLSALLAVLTVTEACIVAGCPLSFSQ